MFRKGDARFEGRSAADAMAAAASDRSCVMVNRNQGSGTRALIDRLLGGARPPGYAVQPRTHNAVAAAVVQGRADWGVTLDTIARSAALGFIPVQHEQYDFVTPRSHADRPAVKAFVALLEPSGHSRSPETSRDGAVTAVLRPGSPLGAARGDAEPVEASGRPGQAQRAGGIVLCGGKSSRMGTSKALLPFGPETMLQRVIRLLGELVSPIVAVAAAGQALPELPPGRDRHPR